MEMPESCLECPFKWAGDSVTYCLAQTPTMKSLMPVKLHEIRWKKFSNAVEKFNWKEDSCPLLPVPPHGDLIDRDALIKDGWLNLHKEVIRMGGYAIHELPLKNPLIPVIIPAEEGE